MLGSKCFSNAVLWLSSFFRFGVWKCNEVVLYCNYGFFNAKIWRKKTNLDYISQESVRLSVLFLYLCKLISEPQRVGLEVKISILPTRNLVFVDVCISCLHGHRAFEWRVQLTCSFPVLTVFMNSLDWNTWKWYVLLQENAFHDSGKCF